MNIPLSFDIELNSYGSINDSVIATNEADNILCFERTSSFDKWSNFLNSKKYSGVILHDFYEEEAPEILDFENKTLCEKIENLIIKKSINYLPDEIDRLTNLKHLSLYNVYSIQPSIKNLIQLEELILENCEDLQFIPFEIYEIQSLKVLTINNLNYYENFSPKISKLFNLEYLTLKNHHPFLHENITKLNKLRCLDIERPQECIYDIPNLEVLSISIPESKLLNGIKKLTKLKELWLNIREFNDEINELQALKYLVISGFYGKTIPNLDKLYNLEVLVFTSCENLEFIPDFVFNLPNLKYLGLSHLHNLKEIPPEINNIPNLVYLELKNFRGFYKIPRFRQDLYVNEIASWGTCKRIN